MSYTANRALPQIIGEAQVVSLSFPTDALPESAAPSLRPLAVEHSVPKLTRALLAEKYGCDADWRLELQRAKRVDWLHA